VPATSAGTATNMATGHPEFGPAAAFSLRSSSRGKATDEAEGSLRWHNPQTQKEFAAWAVRARALLEKRGGPRRSPGRVHDGVAIHAIPSSPVGRVKIAASSSTRMRDAGRAHPSWPSPPPTGVRSLGCLTWRRCRKKMGRGTMTPKVTGPPRHRAPRRDAVGGAQVAALLEVQGATAASCPP